MYACVEIIQKLEPLARWINLERFGDVLAT